MNNEQSLVAQPSALAISNTATALAERERATIQAAMTVAKRFPRDEQAAAAMLLQSADRVGFADKASYAFPRAGSTVTGPSVNLAREFMRAWGNMECGFAVLDSNDEWTTIEAWALDLQTNARTREQKRFRSKIQRKVWKDNKPIGTEWVVPDERDYGELVNRNAAKAVRNVVLSLLPRDVVDDCLARCQTTLQGAASGSINADPQRVSRAILATYQAIGINRAQLEDKIGGTLEAMNAEQLETLRGIYRGISTGEVEASASFPKAETKDETTASALRKKVKDIGKKEGDGDKNPVGEVVDG